MLRGKTPAQSFGAQLFGAHAAMLVSTMEQGALQSAHSAF